MYDFRLILYVWVLSIIGILVINSAADGFAVKQLMGFIGGSVVMIFFSLIDYNYIAKFEWFLYSINIGMLIAVKLLGINVNGATRWFSLGPFGTFQPSELSKVIMLIIFAHLISEQKEKINNLTTIIKIGILYVIPMLLVALEPDLSTTLVFAFLFCTMMFVGGLSYKIIGIILGISVPLAGLLIWYIQQPGQILLHGYQLQRILTFLNPSDYLLTTYHQQYNSIMAIGSGMLTGKGLNNNTITSVKGGNFISEPQTDFIFAVAGEEYGFVGCVVIVVLLLAISIECIRMSLRAKDLSGKILCCGMGGLIALQSFINICVATGLAPNTGTPLPFVSYGLTSLVSLYIGMGIVLNVGLQSSVYNKELMKKEMDRKEDYL